MPRLVAPFGPTSLTGLEIELLAGPRHSRKSLARALAKRLGGRVRYGLKHNVMTIDEVTGQPVPCCELTPACQVVDRRNHVVATLVDDFSIRQSLDRAAPPRAFAWRLVMDDVRLAAWAARALWGDNLSLEQRLQPLLQTFGASLGRYGEGLYCKPEHRLVRDAEGNVLAVVAPYGEERDRVTEVVTRPLRRDERAASLALILNTAQALGFTFPPQGSIHAHLDAAPWRDTRRLRQLLLDYNRHRAALHRRIAPNPRSAMWRGPFDAALLTVAKRIDRRAPFWSFAKALEQAGPVKNRDLNILGVIRRRHRQPTLEVRMLPLDGDANATLSRIAEVETLLSSLARRADGAK